MTKTEFKLSPDQQQALDVFMTGANVALMGEAGTGKSTVVKYFIEKMKKERKNVAVVAPTGVAAINVGGSTIHSLFKLGTAPQMPKNLEEKKYDAKLAEVLSTIDILVIDEISMVRADLFFAIDYRFRQYGDKNLPFGGKQVIAVGDFFQLPPVVTSDRIDGTEQLLEDFLIENHGGKYAFQSPKWKEGKMRLQYLTEVHRQSDKLYIEMLNHCRWGKWDPKLYGNITISDKANGAVCLTPTRSEAERRNAEELAVLKTKQFSYAATLEGDFVADDKKKTSDDKDPAPRKLLLKEGARIIMIINDKDHGYVNGDTGIVKKLTNDSVQVIIDRNNLTINLSRHIWEKTRYVYDKKRDRLIEEVTGKFIQYPLRLAYALTIHKSQGMTLEKAHICFGRGGVFAPGQLYVAMSRCKTLEGLTIDRPLKKEDVFTDSIVKDFYENYENNGTAFLSTEDVNKKNSLEEIPEKENIEDPNTISVDVPIEIYKDIMAMINHWRNTGEKPKHTTSDSSVVQKRQSKSETEQDISNYSDAVQAALAKLSPAEKQLYCLLRDQGSAQAKDLAEQQGVSTAWVRRAMANLVRAGLVERKGSKKTGQYESKENEEFSYSGKCKRCPLFSQKDIS